MVGLPAQNVLQTPEVTPALDEHSPVIGPNLAAVFSQEVQKKLIEYMVGNYWYSYSYLQQRFWNVWRQLDEMWRAKVQIIDLNIPVKQWGQQMRDSTLPNVWDGFTQQISPTDMHKQWDALLKIGVQISFEGGSLPVRAIKPTYCFESLYNPVQSTVDAVNEILPENAREANLTVEWRKNYHAFLKYGHAWAETDLERKFEVVNVKYTLSPNPQEQQMAAQMLSTIYGTQQPQVMPSMDGTTVLVYQERKVKSLYTHFRHLNPEDVLCDYFIDCTNMDKQPCPWVRRHIGQFAIEDNDYDPENNPFGWVNIDLAIQESGNQYVLSDADEVVFRQRLQHRYNVSDQVQMKPHNTIKQLWTCYPKMRVRQDGTIWERDANGNAPAGERPPLKRYVVQFYGNPYIGMTCIRWQEWPEGMRVPIKWAADMIEDTTCAIPQSKGEVAMNDFFTLAKMENIALHGKELQALRGWKKKTESPAFDVDCNKPGVTIPFDTDPDEAVRVDGNTFDEWVTLIPYMQERQQRIQEVLGATDQLLGELATGRRSAAEITNAIDASKNPIVVTIDSYNTQMMGERGWAGDVVRNLDLFGDRDWIRKKTHREFFGKVNFDCKVAENYLRKMNQMAFEAQMIQTLPNLIPVLPQIGPVVTQILQRTLDNNGLADIIIPGDDLWEQQAEAMSIISKILGSGVLIPPMPDDPDDVFIRIFSSAIRKIQEGDDYWSDRSQGTLPMLQQRLMLQQQQAAMKQAAMLQQQIAMQQQLNPPKNSDGEPNKDSKRPAPKGNDGPPTPGNAIQSAQGPQGMLAQAS